jgi:hypothetical protein
MKANEYEQVEFIKKYLRDGLKRAPILVKFRKRWGKCSENTFDRRLAIAEKQLQAEIAKIQETAIDSIKEQANDLISVIMPVIERQAILSEIARGRRTVQQVIVTKFGVETIDQFPSHTDIKNAISELNKMDGGYSPVKVDHNVIGITAIEVLHTEAIPIDHANEGASK